MQTNQSQNSVLHLKMWVLRLREGKELGQGCTVHSVSKPGFKPSMSHFSPISFVVNAVASIDIYNGQRRKEGLGDSRGND